MKRYLLLSVLFLILASVAHARLCPTRVKIGGTDVDLQRFEHAETLFAAVGFLSPGQKLEARFLFKVVDANASIALQESFTAQGLNGTPQMLGYMSKRATINLALTGDELKDVLLRPDLVDILEPKPQGGVLPGAPNPFHTPDELPDLTGMNDWSVRAAILDQYPDALTVKALSEIDKTRLIRDTSIQVRMFMGQLQKLDPWLKANGILMVTPIVENDFLHPVEWHSLQHIDPLNAVTMEFRGPRSALLKLLYANLPIRKGAFGVDQAAVQSRQEANLGIVLKFLYPEAGILNTDTTDFLSDALTEALLTKQLPRLFVFEVPVVYGTDEEKLFGPILKSTGGAIVGSRGGIAFHTGDALGVAPYRYRIIQISGTVSTVMQIARAHSELDGPRVLDLRRSVRLLHRLGALIAPGYR